MNPHSSHLTPHSSLLTPQPPHSSLLTPQDISNVEERFTLRYHILDSYFKVMFVRDPLQRLLSAYRDKFTGDFYLLTGTSSQVTPMVQ